MLSFVSLHAMVGSRDSKGISKLTLIQQFCQVNGDGDRDGDGDGDGKWILWKMEL